MRLFDTKKRGYVNWRPARDVRVYVCGITPYDSAHLGHVFTFLTYDLITRRLKDDGHNVDLVRNVTDVDEPIYTRAAELGIPYTQLAASETAEFEDVMRRLNFLQPSHEPRASEYIGQMAEAAASLLESGHAYFVDQDVYFDAASISDFGRAGCFSEKLRMGLFKKRGGDPARPGKRNPFDFLLWKAVPDPTDLAQWDAGRGLPKGRPGWHIECTVMSHELLGVPFDLHGGGNDLIFPHHEAEIAQAKALYGEPPAKFWVHTAPILYGGEKMSKSLGNLVFARDMLKDHSANAIRLAMLHYHYREGGEWIPELLDEATAFLLKLRPAIEHAGHDQAAFLLESLRAELDNDLDTHAALHSLEAFTKGAPGHGGSGRELASQAIGLLGISFD